MDEMQSKLLNLLGALETTEQEKKDVVKSFKETIDGIKREIKTVRLQLTATNSD